MVWARAKKSGWIHWTKDVEYRDGRQEGKSQITQIKRKKKKGNRKLIYINPDLHLIIFRK